ncbi:PLP-dependent aminotransferase family protein [Brevibacillus sp. TJ4]|uniref:aminotransferase-like domain-containing protein n=1 Tax=Brevibacillus sp. TJ4 TaxID=3234853 RepID=UPI0037D85B6D
MHSVTPPVPFSRRTPQLALMGAAYSNKDPHVMPLSYGYPAPECFPIDAIAQATESALRTQGTTALQYTGGPGQQQVVSWICQRSTLRHMSPETNQVLVTTGSMQAIDMATRVLSDVGDEVWVEAPTFFGSIRSFTTNGLKVRSFPVDEQGLCVDAVEAALEQAAQDNSPLPKLFYTMPNYQNPAGVSLSLERRKKLAQLALEYNFFILEDDAYVELSFSGMYQPSIYSFAPERVVYISTFSKIIAPGLRMGWAIADSRILEKMRLFKPDGLTSVFMQEVVGQLLMQMDFSAHLNRMASLYHVRCSHMVAELRSQLGGDIEFQVPKGGYFVWARFAEGVDTSLMLPIALECGVSYLDGKHFFLNGEGSRYARLCFTYCDETQMSKAIAALAEAARTSQGKQ